MSLKKSLSLVQGPDTGTRRALSDVEGRAIDRRSIDGRSIDGCALDGRSIDGRSIDGRSIDGCSIDGRSNFTGCPALKPATTSPDLVGQS